MRKLTYVGTKGTATVETASYAEANQLKEQGFKVETVLTNIPEPTYSFKRVAKDKYTVEKKEWT